MKGIILAAGKGSRLSPLTTILSKCLLPVYDKPMIYYPLSVLMEAGIREILIITTPQDKERFIKLLGDGSHLGIALSYEIEKVPKGIGQAFIIGEEFIDGDHVTLILGDSIFQGEGLFPLIEKAKGRKEGATVFSYFVQDPEKFGVVCINEKGRAISLEEKPLAPKSNLAVTGLYFYDYHVVEIAKSLGPSERGELEITDINKAYLKKGNLHVEVLGKEMTWFDTGTISSLSQASKFIEISKNNQNINIGCIEEVAFQKGFITYDQFVSLSESLLKSDYGQYLLNVKGTE